jgi:hypothetical protein
MARKRRPLFGLAVARRAELDMQVRVRVVEATPALHQDGCTCRVCDFNAFCLLQEERLRKRLRKVSRADLARRSRRRKALDHVREDMHRGWIGTTALPTLDYYDGRRES